MGFAERVPADADGDAADVFHARRQRLSRQAEGQAGRGSDAAAAISRHLDSFDEPHNGDEGPGSGALDAILEAARAEEGTPGWREPGAARAEADSGAGQGGEGSEARRPLQVDLADMENPLRPRYTGGLRAGRWAVGGGGGEGPARSGWLMGGAPSAACWSAGRPLVVGPPGPVPAPPGAATAGCHML